MKSLATILAACLVLFAGPAVADGKPDVSERYQRNVDRAWATADKGRGPSSICGLVVGAAARPMEEGSADEKRDALQAIEACYVTVILRYLSRALDGIEAGTVTCAGPMGVMSMHRGSLGRHMTNMGLDRAEYDARIAAATGDRVRAACPDFAGSILGEG